jgi:hypothetical protein
LESKQKTINTVIAHKDRIVKTTNEIIEKLSRLQKSYISEKETSVYVKKRVNQVVSDLSIIAGFCGAREKGLIELTDDMVRIILLAEDKIGFVGLMEDWCITVNSTIVDFTKTPFRFVGGEFKVNLRNLEGKIKTILKRE